MKVNQDLRLWPENVDMYMPFFVKTGKFLSTSGPVREAHQQNEFAITNERKLYFFHSLVKFRPGLALTLFIRRKVYYHFDRVSRFAGFLGRTVMNYSVQTKQPTPKTVLPLIELEMGTRAGGNL